MKKEKKIRNIKDKSGKIEVWQQYYEEKVKENIEETNVLRGENLEHEGNEDITINEVKEAINDTKIGKAEGRDEITPKYIKYGGETLQTEILKLCNRIWQGEEIPQDWNENIIVPNYKKGNTLDCSNYKAICLSSTASKVYTRILVKKTKKTY